MAARRRGRRREYGEKKFPMNNVVTPTAQAGLNAIADGFKISRSELLEQIGRGLLKVTKPTQEQP